MVKTKHQKSSKPKKQPHIKKHGKQADISEFRAQLDALGLKIIVVTADGNCFFRAIADQLEGNEDEHMKYRSMVVQFIMKHREMFEPFIEDDVPFDEYCQSMEKDGTWAGNMELQAASLVTHSNICIHLKMSPRWYIQNFENHESRMIHLSFHDSEQHYNSVRLKEDTCSGPARPIIIKADADLSGKSYQEKAAAVIKAKRGAGKTIIQEESIKLAMIGSGCQNEEKIEEVLLQVGGNIDAAIEFFISEQETEEYKIEDDNFTGSVDTSHGCSSDNQNKKGEQCIEKVEDCTLKQQSCSQIEKAGYDTRYQHVEKQNIPRNKMCPCGSKKKYKSCCGTVAARSSARFSVSQTVDYGKSRKDKKQGKKGSSNIANSHASDRGPPDLGALCI